MKGGKGMRTTLIILFLSLGIFFNVWNTHGQTTAIDLQIKTGEKKKDKKISIDEEKKDKKIIPELSKFEQDSKASENKLTPFSSYLKENKIGETLQKSIRSEFKSKRTDKSDR